MRRRAKRPTRAAARPARRGRQAATEPRGGEVAGDRLTRNREPGQYTLYLPGDPGAFVIEHRLRADAGGDVEILHKFWQFEPAAGYAEDLVPPLLTYADLMATPDPRNHDTAKQIFDRFLADAARTTR